MKNWILTQWNKLSERQRWALLMFAQVWAWPQVLDPAMPAGFGFSLIVTMACAVVYNLVRVIDAQ